MNQCGSVRCKKRSRRLLRCWQGKAWPSPRIMGLHWNGNHPNNGEAFRKFPRFLECFLKDPETNCEGVGEKKHPRNCERNHWFCTGFTFNSIPEILPPQRCPHGWVIQQCAAQVESKMLRCYRSSVDCRLGMHIYREGIQTCGFLSCPLKQQKLVLKEFGDKKVSCRFSLHHPSPNLLKIQSEKTDPKHVETYADGSKLVNPPADSQKTKVGKLSHGMDT